MKTKMFKSIVAGGSWFILMKVLSFSSSVRRPLALGHTAPGLWLSASLALSQTAPGSRILLMDHGSIIITFSAQVRSQICYLNFYWRVITSKDTRMKSISNCFFWFVGIALWAYALTVLLDWGLQTPEIRFQMDFQTLDQAIVLEFLKSEFRKSRNADFSNFRHLLCKTKCFPQLKSEQ